MNQKQDQFQYTVNEVPPARHLFFLSLQHVFLMIVSLSLPILFANQLNGSIEFTNALVSISMIVAGLGSIIQSVGIPFIGSKYLCPNVCGPSYFALSLSAAWTGGLALMKGMIIFAGLIEMAMAPIVEKLKFAFPSHVVGLVVAMVGVSIIKPSVTSLYGVSLKGDSVSIVFLIVGVITLLIMVLANIWGKGIIRIYCLLTGIIVGWIIAIFLLPNYAQSLSVVKSSAWFATPKLTKEFLGFKFDPKLIVPFMIIGISGSLKSFGNLIAAQKMSEPNLKKPDFSAIRKGLLADGFTTALAGLIGGLAVDTSSSNIGLAGATKVVSRWISVGAGVMFLTLAFFPKFVTFLSLMPKPVLGASILFAGSFMISTGLKEMFEKEWDTKKTFVVGISLMLGLSTAFLPELYARAPEFIQTLFTDPLPTTAILAVTLNLLFNLDVLFKKSKKTIA
ncbi:MAG: purine/pyrimidine permease [Caldisericia bacterium]|nr:purine/pyrimidine permease [Caldisericia bacterium]